MKKNLLGSVHPAEVPAAMISALQWTPESALRDALIAERLPAAIAGRTLFWINIQQYLSHRDSQLPPEEYLRHWRDIYQCCLTEDTRRLQQLSYLSLQSPADISN
jgi:hypothetical protein